MSSFKAALACIGDFARMMESSFFNNATSVIKKLLEYINSNLDRDIKLCIISCLGDLVLAIQDYATNFIDELLRICDICFQAVYELCSSQKDIDYIE